MRRRANSCSLWLRAVVCLLAAVMVMPPCTSQLTSPHALRDGMDCCPSNATMQAPQVCCTLHTQKAEVAQEISAPTLPAATGRVLPEVAVALPAAAPAFRVGASPPPLMHPILRI